MRPLKVLVADDNMINQRIAREMLSKLGHTGVVVGDGQKALRAIEAFAFDVVLMDVMMPVMDGLEAVAAIREKELSTSRRQKILFVTSHAEPGDDLRFIAAGGDGYLAKPIDIELLDKALRKMSNA
jgi:CheY-like chemotaxis protein